MGANFYMQYLVYYDLLKTEYFKPEKPNYNLFLNNYVLCQKTLCSAFESGQIGLLDFQKQLENIFELMKNKIK